jgi:hypothetical protein
MATTHADSRPLDGDRPIDVPVAVRTTRPVKAWALAGCLVWCFQIFVLLKWVTGPSFKQIHPGPTPLPGAMKTAIVVYLCGQWVAFFTFGYRWVVKPLRVDRRLSFNGMLFLTWCAWYWLWDPFGNYESITYSYNAWIPNMGSWVTSIPGWNTPTVPEPWLFTAGLYGMVMVGTSLVGCAIMRAVRRRFPTMGTPGLLACVYASFFVLATIFELTWMRVGFYTYLATPSGLPNFFPSHYYKYPAVEGLFFGAMLTSMTYLRWSIDDRGESRAERGASTLKLKNGPMNGLRLLSIVGFTNVVVFIVFYVPYLLIWSPHPASVPLDIQSRSYFMNGLCGPGTHAACPNDNIPLFRPGSITITPDGKLYVPPGVKLPHDPTTFAQAKRALQAQRR